MPLLLLLVAGLFSYQNWVQASVPATYGLSPDNAQTLLIDTIKSAKKELLINIYEFNHPKIRDAVLAQIRAGVTVKVLIEGEPVGGLAQNSRDLIVKVIDGMRASGNKNNAAFLMKKSPKGKRRYSYDHAKYIVKDSETVYMASENFAQGAHPTPGMQGNRGWHIVLNDSGAVSDLKATFAEDTKLDFGDVIDLLKNPIPPVEAAPTPGKPEVSRDIPPASISKGYVDSVKLIRSPNSLQGLIDLIRSASHTLSVEFMSLPPNWGQSQNPLVAEIMAAADRGVDVRVLLNDSTVFGGTPDQDKNIDTLCALAEKNIAGRIVSIKDVEISYIHNKGVLVDDFQSLVSSINGTQNSVMKNRETGLVIQSGSANSYFTSAFDLDWNDSPALSESACKGKKAVNQGFLSNLRLK